MAARDVARPQSCKYDLAAHRMSPDTAYDSIAFCGFAWRDRRGATNQDGNPPINLPRPSFAVLICGALSAVSWIVYVAFALVEPATSVFLKRPGPAGERNRRCHARDAAMKRSSMPSTRSRPRESCRWSAPKSLDSVETSNLSVSSGLEAAGVGLPRSPDSRMISRTRRAQSARNDRKPGCRYKTGTADPPKSVALTVHAVRRPDWGSGQAAPRARFWHIASRESQWASMYQAPRPLQSPSVRQRT